MSVQKVLGGEAFRSLVAAGVLPQTLPSAKYELDRALDDAIHSPAVAAHKPHRDAVDTLKAALHVTGLDGLREGLDAIQMLPSSVGAEATRFGGMVSHPLLAGAQAATGKPVNVGRAEFLRTIPTPSQIVAHLDKWVWGQGNAKMIVANAVYAHYKRMATIADCKTRGVPVPDELLKKNNIFMVGPTGSGKTLIAQTIAKILGVPFAHADATSLTAAGYVGEDVESILTKLLQNAGGDLEKAQRGIVFIDEIDKKRKPEGENMSITRDVSGADVQQGLLKLVEGTVVNVQPQNGRRHPGAEMVALDTSNILFIAGGAFSGIDREYARRTQEKGGMGFGAKVRDPDAKVDLAEAYAKIEPQDFISFGMMPEFVGRFPAIAGLMPLTIPDLKRIITEPVDAIAKQWTAYFASEGVELELKPKALQAFAERAHTRGTGARGLSAIFEQTFRKAMFEIPDKPDVNKIVVDANLEPRYVKGRKKAPAVAAPTSDG